MPSKTLGFHLEMLTSVTSISGTESVALLQQEETAEVLCVGYGTITAKELLEGNRELKQNVSITAAPALWDPNGLRMGLMDQRHSKSVVCPFPFPPRNRKMNQLAAPILNVVCPFPFSPRNREVHPAFS
jgi:hypothetical protein